MLLRKGNAGSNTAADHIAVVRAALKQLPNHRPGRRPGRRVLVRADGGGCTHAFLDWLAGQRLQYSIGFALPTDFAEVLEKIPEQVWTPAYDADGQIRDGAHVAEVTDLLDLTRLAGGDAGDRPPGTPAPRRPAADHRRRRLADHRVRHQHPSRRPRHPAAGPGAAAPPPGPRRGPDPVREGHRPDEPAAARLRPEPDLVRHRRPGLRTARLAGDARLQRQRRQTRRQTVGAQAATAAAAVDPRPTRPHRPAPPDCASRSRPGPGSRTPPGGGSSPANHAWPSPLRPAPQQPRPWKPATPGPTPADLSHPPTRITSSSRPEPPTNPHTARSRKIEASTNCDPSLVDGHHT